MENLTASNSIFPLWLSMSIIIILLIIVYVLYKMNINCKKIKEEDKILTKQKDEVLS